MSDNNRLFIAAARTLYGEQWQSPIARDLEMSVRHIARIAAGQAEARPGMLIDLWRLMLDRQFEMDKLIDEIKVVSGRQDLPEPEADN